MTPLLRAVLAVVLLLTPFSLHAQSFTDQLDDAAVEVYGSEDAAAGDLAGVLGNLISVVLSVLGVLLLGIILYAGYLWMTAGGNTEQVGKAKSWIINAVVGLIVTLAAYAIAQFVFDALSRAGLV